jgi:fimbrial chaperone protein
VRRTRAGVLLGLLLLTAIPAVLQAFRFEPISREFAPQGAASVRTFQVTNTNQSRIAVRVRMTTRSLTPSGEEVRRDASPQFVVFPSRLVLEPDQSQTIRVQWSGPESLEQERSYRIIAEQLPVDFAEEGGDGANLKILFRYVGSVYVVPEGAAPDVRVAGTEWVEADGERRLAVTVENQGTAHTILEGLELRLSSGHAEGARRVLGSEALPELSGSNLLAGASRRVLVELPDAWHNHAVEAMLSYERQP